ncbi:hypothetical protein J2T56_001581 [Natronobacillus azotifigens]|uniref:Uncharacterized protein n=1 Tax=Natronobacillus azotifigens TaxID=472978 RepID=A0A9J6R9P8_9BACI|nr:hypothetical protein [Natronobacillus azotifigens]MCZ0702086.1 hypothetical protein [Natronobacillus azotifigens]
MTVKKPSVIIPSSATIVLLIPFVLLLMNIVTNNYEHLFLLALLSGPTIVCITIFWSRFFYYRMNWCKLDDHFMALLQKKLTKESED